MIVDYPRKASSQQERCIQRHKTEGMIEFCVSAVRTDLPEMIKSLATITGGHDALEAASSVETSIRLLAMYLADIHESLA